MWLALLWVSIASAQAPFEQWSYAVEVVDRHPSLLTGTRIGGPASTWQTLLGVVLPGKSVHAFHRHCLHLRVPTKGDGILRVTLMAPEQSCAGAWEGTRVWEATGVDDVRVTVDGMEVRLWWSDPSARQFRTRGQAVAGVFLFSPYSDPTGMTGATALWLDGHACDLVDGTCRRCQNGFLRVIGEKDLYRCGVDRCGEVGQPACPRGVRWQKGRGPFGCRGDDGHVFCAKGLKIECLGSEAYCR
jgi:hypothetical protein